VPTRCPACPYRERKAPLQDIFSCYKRSIVGRDNSHIEDCRRKATLKETIKQAALSINNQGIRHGHQWEIRENKLTEFSAALVRIEANIQAARNFDDLVHIIGDAGIFREDTLIVYDTAIRIGAKLGMEPRIKIYLHSGSLEGAKALYKRNGMRLPRETHVYKDEVERLPDTIKGLQPAQWEDFFCICKKCI